MSKSKGTKQTQSDNENIELFPSRLIGKKLLRDNQDIDFIEPKALDLLEKYLETRNPDYLIQAIIHNPALIKDRGASRDIKEYLKEIREKRSNLYLDAYRVVKESIKWWQQIISFIGDEKEAKLAKKLLSKVLSPIDIMHRKECVVGSKGDGFVHITEKEEGKHPYLTYVSPIAYVQYFENVKAKFSTKKKRYYKTETQPSHLKEIADQELKGLALVHEIHKRKDPAIVNIRRLIKDELRDNISEDELKSFELADVSTITASYIAWKHEKRCKDCKKLILGRRHKAKMENRPYKVGYKTFLRLYKKAKKELQDNEWY